MKMEPPPSAKMNAITPLKPDERFILQAEISRLKQLHLSCFEKQSTTIEKLQIKNKDQETEITRLMKSYKILEATLEEQRRSNQLKIDEMVLEIKSLNIKLGVSLYKGKKY